MAEMRLLALAGHRGAKLLAMFRKDNPPPPPHLSVKAKELWRELHREYDLGDTSALILLEGALTAYDRAAEARAAIKKYSFLYAFLGM